MNRNNSMFLMVLIPATLVVGLYAIGGAKPLENKVEITLNEPQPKPKKELQELLTEMNKIPRRSPASIGPVDR
jgi:hypothetical protein